MQGSERRICRPHRAEIALSSRKTVDRFTTLSSFVGNAPGNLNPVAHHACNSAITMISIKYSGDNRGTCLSTCHNAPPGVPMPASVARGETI
ncbi:MULTISPECIES: hypothetical protein [unclassified Burkholderia]|uniref:hypothetical protein n=1 Tax=unclassified Burkholderia TaxID=2613784 RepID=UPI0012E334B0|nr:MULTISPECIES: hypothetical protein [unclassified Burkholderia]